jgi:hypothetical protein
MVRKEARDRRRSKSALLREVIEGAFTGAAAAVRSAAEERRQSLLVSQLDSEQETLRFIERAADLRRWMPHGSRRRSRLSLARHAAGGRAPRRSTAKRTTRD